MRRYLNPETSPETRLFVGFLSHRPPNTRHVQDVGCLGQSFPNGLTKTRNSGRRYDSTPSQKIIPKMKHHQTQKKTSLDLCIRHPMSRKKHMGHQKTNNLALSTPPKKKRRRFKLKLPRLSNLRSTELPSRPQRREYAYYDPSRRMEVPCSFYLAPRKGILAE